MGFNGTTNQDIVSLKILKKWWSEVNRIVENKNTDYFLTQFNLF